MTIIENIPMPARASGVTIERVPMPKAKANKPKVSPGLKNAARAYKQAYVKVYGQNPRITYDGTWVRFHGTKEGVSVRRLRAMTTLLLNRIA